MFFASGAATLIFEIVWLHGCGLVFGNSAWASTIVLSSFMGGLGAGNGLAMWLGRRAAPSLRMYAALELTAAASGLLLTFALTHLAAVVAATTTLVADKLWIVNAARFVLSFGLLLVPTTVMGATLPILVGSQCRSRQDLGPVLGRLYGWNTLGGATGAVAAELMLIARCGLIGSAVVAALLDAGAAIIALAASRGTPTRPVERALTVTPSLRRSACGWLLVCSFCCGAELLALEVIWSRMLSLFVVASTLAVSLVLAVVLTGLGLGALTAAAWLRRHSDSGSLVPVVALASASSVALTYTTFRWLAGPWAAEWYRIVWFACALTLPTSFSSGLLFTLIGRALSGRSASETSTSAWLTLANTAGAVCGPWLAVFVLLSMAGIERSMFVASAGYMAIAAIAIVALRLARRSWPISGRLVATAVVSAIVLATFPFGLMQTVYLPRTVAEFSRDGAQITAVREGQSATIVLMTKSWRGRPLYHRLVTDGYSMSGTNVMAKRYMRYFVYWPLMTHRAPLRHVAVICYGVGTTADAAATIPGVESVDIVEISPDILAMSNQIYAPADQPLRAPGVRVHVEDGRYFLEATRERFDLITGEPPPPLTPGTVNLYTQDYFQLVRDRLAPGGMATYWLPVARRGEYDIKSIIRAFCNVFDDCSLWNATVFDWMLVGTRQAPGPVSEEQFSHPFRDPATWPRLREIGFERPEQIGTTFLGDAGYLREITADTLPLTDDWPKRLRPAAGRLSLAQTQPDVENDLWRFADRILDPERARLAFRHSPLVQRLWPASEIERTDRYFDLQREMNGVMREGANPLRHIESLHAILTGTELRRLPLWMLGSDDAQQQIAGETDDGTAATEYVLGVRALVARQYGAAATYLAASAGRGLDTPMVRSLLAYTLCMSGKFETAARIMKEAKPAAPEERHFRAWLERQFPRILDEAASPALPPD